MVKATKKRKRAKKLTIGQKMRGLNILYPWFKIVAGVMLGLVAVFVVWGMMRHESPEVEIAEQEESITNETESKAEPKMRASKVWSGVKPADLSVRQLKDKKLIALTFDDGPSSATSMRLLDILKEKKAKATFFVIGKMAQGAPEILQREEREGHVVGSHTMGHVDLTTLEASAIQQDVAAIDEVFKTSLGHATKLARPPYGAINDAVKTGVQQPLVTWTIDPEDWRTKDAEAVRRHVVERAFDGAVVLMHDIYPTTVDAVGGIIDTLRKEGYEFLTIPEMARAREVKLENGVVYASFRP